MSQCIWYYSWNRARNSQECINSTTGVVLAPEVQPGPHQVIITIDGTDVFALFTTPNQSQVLMVQWLWCWTPNPRVVSSIPT